MRGADALVSHMRALSAPRRSLRVGGETKMADVVIVLDDALLKF